MKKSQILAALALAFALGVVVPVAGLADNASAYSEAKGTATYNDTTNAISFVENDATYKAYVKLEDAKRAYTNGSTNGTIADLAAVSGDTKLASVASSINDKLQSANKMFGYNKTSIQSDLKNTVSFTDQIAKMIADAKTSELYNALADVISILADNNATDSQLVAAATKVRTVAGYYDGNTKVGLALIDKAQYDNLHPEEAKLSVYRTATPYDNWGTYTDAKAIHEAIENAEEALAKYENGYKLFMPWMVDTANFMTDAAKNAIKGNVNVQPSELNTAALVSANFNRIAQLSALYNEVQDAKSSRVAADSGDNYSIIGDLAQAWKEATGNEEALKTVMARMAAYKAPANSDNNGNNTDTTIKPGNTGLVGSAEGTATTVSIVAGLATALTALGAGVVVYRNARREK